MLRCRFLVNRRFQELEWALLCQFVFRPRYQWFVNLRGFALEPQNRPPFDSESEWEPRCRFGSPVLELELRCRFLGNPCFQALFGWAPRYQAGPGWVP